MQHAETSAVSDFPNDVERKPLAQSRDRPCVPPATGILPGGSILPAKKCGKFLDVVQDTSLELFQSAVGKDRSESTTFESVEVFVDRTQNVWAVPTGAISSPCVWLANIGSHPINIVEGGPSVEPQRVWAGADDVA